MVIDNSVRLRTLPSSMKLTFCNGTVLHRNQVRSTFGDWLDGITELSKSLPTDASVRRA